MTKETLFDIIKYVENAGFPVVAIVSDLGGGNRGLHKELGITITKTYFLSPINYRKVCLCRCASFDQITKKSLCG